MTAKVVPLAKEHATVKVTQTRPITISSLLYRFWARTLVRCLLHKWATWMPSSACGFLPGRCPNDWHYRMQLLLEGSNKGLRATQYGGLTLDIIKCFNCLPHAPIGSLMKKLGVKASLVDTWLASVAQVERYWLLQDQAFSAGTPSTGLPEGDPLAVAGMNAVNMLWISHIVAPDVWASAYADNWTYVAAAPRAHTGALRKLHDITGALRLNIDWSKTWGWGTSRGHKHALQMAKRNLALDELQLTLVTQHEQ
eukprot:Skav202268  [mRNA]  locus=scaffold1687:45732:46490:- [translate_table: standard]